jgi:hypothetical protein
MVFSAELANKNNLFKLVIGKTFIPYSFFLTPELLIAQRGVSHTPEWAQALRPYLLIAFT